MSAGGRLRRVLSLLVLARVAALGVSPAAKLSRMQGILHVCSQLEEDWASLSAASPHLRFAQIGSAAHAGASSIHGRGLFAARRLGVGEVVAFYPVHTLGDSTHAFELAPREGDGALESGTLESGTLESGTLESGTLESGALESGTLGRGTLESGTLESGTLESGASEALPASQVLGSQVLGSVGSGGETCDETAYRVALPPSPGLQGWAEDLWVDADPRRRLVAGWTAHLVNEGIACNQLSEAGVKQARRRRLLTDVASCHSLGRCVGPPYSLLMMNCR